MALWQFSHRMRVPYIHPLCKIHGKDTKLKFFVKGNLCSNNLLRPNATITSYSQARRNKKLFWLSAIAPLLSVILSTLLVFVTRADKHGVKIIQHVTGGLNPSSVKQLQLKGPYVGECAKIGLVCAVIALTVRRPFSMN